MKRKLPAKPPQARPRSKKMKPWSRQERYAFAEQLLLASVALPLAEALQSAGETPAGLAKKLQLSEGYIRRLLRAEGNPSLKTLAQMFETLRCELQVTLAPIDNMAMPAERMYRVWVANRHNMVAPGRRPFHHAMDVCEDR